MGKFGASLGLVWGWFGEVELILLVRLLDGGVLGLPVVTEAAEPEVIGLVEADEAEVDLMI